LADLTLLNELLHIEVVARLPFLSVRVICAKEDVSAFGRKQMERGAERDAFLKITQITVSKISKTIFFEN